MKKQIALLLSCLLVAGCTAGCGSSGSAAKASGTSSLVTVKYFEPGTKPKDYGIVTDKINRKLKPLGIRLERQYIPFDSWTQKINLMLSTGDEFDLFPIMADQTTYTAYNAKGALADLSQAVKKYGPNLKKYIPSDAFKAATVNKKLVTVPVMWMDYASEGEFDIRTDLLKQNGLDIPKTPDELLNDCKTVQKNWKGSKKLYMSFVPNYDPLSTHMTVLHRTYSSYPFTVLDGFFYVNQNGTVKPYIETDEFKKDCDFMHKAYTMGLINPDILTYQSDQLNNDLSSGNWFVLFGSGGNLAGIRKNDKDATNKDVQAVYFNSDKQYLRPMVFKNSVSVSSTSKHVDASIKFLNWLYASQSNYDLYFYGIKGKHFEPEANNCIKYITDSKNNNSTDYSDSDWMTGNMHFERIDNVNNFPSNNDVLYKENKDAVDSIAAGFNFNTSKVETQYTNLQTAASAAVTPLAMGVQDYDTSYKSALAKMKAAGLDKVESEFSRQFKEFRGSGQ